VFEERHVYRILFGETYWRYHFGNVNRGWSTLFALFTAEEVYSNKLRNIKVLSHKKLFWTFRVCSGKPLRQILINLILLVVHNYSTVWRFVNFDIRNFVGQWLSTLKEISRTFVTGYMESVRGHVPGESIYFSLPPQRR